MNNVIVASVQTFEKLRSMSSSNIKETMSRDFQLPMFFIIQSNLVSELSGKSSVYSQGFCCKVSRCNAVLDNAESLYPVPKLI